MDNSIKQYAIGELLDGRYFYIPSYQRGYRWTEKQVGDLLRDLLCFANDFANEGKEKKQDQFYCLQPVIARPITDEDKLKSMFGTEYNEGILSHGVWEIIDGQQRLTTIFLLYKYLLDQKGWNAETLKEEEDGKELYHICYATRDGSTKFLEGLTMKTIKDNDEDILRDNVDYFHMANAFKYISEWIKTDGKTINIRYQLGGSLDNIRNSFFKLLNGMSDTKGGSVQILWYEIAEVKEKNNIKEFQKINTGKIRLTDAELIKGLFLLKKNFTSGDKYIKQSELALEWEYIENTLHANNFWYFLQKKGYDMPNRIDLLFNLIYKKNALKEIPETEWDAKIKEIDAQLMDTRQSEIFRFYYNRFEGKMGEDLQHEVAIAWDEVMELFRTLDDWFCTPSIYNYIGLLSQCGEDLCRLVLHFEYMPETTYRDDFEKYLKKRISYHLRGAKIDDENKQILNTYDKDHDTIYKLLLTLNIHLLNEQNKKLESESDVYKFPFDVLSAQNWDIEHIDSFHTNALKKEKDKRDWIETAMADRKDELKDDEIAVLKQKLDENALDDVINILKKNAQEVDADEEIKNTIGNLTLLDAATNRMYGNSLFCTKRRVIIERIKQGVFVPIVTQYIFAKFFDEKGTNRSLWTKEDMEAYHKYIYEALKEYIKLEEVEE
ncbi:DUF262 domain-containing protein [Phocaeicola vulgatus]|jgi:hypothetical protein|uniref:DUF262 domain-containing protein n=1 Tax=Phocaeicola vulgatus TaxID=821 RepID=A0A415DEQ7_PHOVU|nr:DUF262 domain-containing protein [Phocaeicola vulgatus]RHJ74594.1 DUF262 domain-containing protein [Phocaeicola vulgatus]